MSLGLEGANRNQGLEVIPSGTEVELVMKIRPGNVGLENLCKRTKKGNAEGIDVECTVRGAEYNGRKVFGFYLLDGETAGHSKAAEITRSLLLAIFEAVHGIDPKDTSPETIARRASATLAGFNGATFLATVEIERGGKNPEGGNYKDKNVIAKVLRVGDQGYRKLDQPPPAPIERSAPPQSAQVGAPAVAATAIARPDWAQ
jgi:hypothetical protein